MPPSSAVCWRTTSTACSAVLACLAIRIASSTITITIAAATAITTISSTIPTCHAAEDASEAHATPSRLRAGIALACLVMSNPFSPSEGPS